MVGDEGKANPSPAPVLRANVLYFDANTGMLRLSVSPEIDRKALQARLQAGEPVTIEIVQRV